MDFISVKEYAAAHGLAERTVRNYCVQGKIPGAKLVGKTWSLPVGAALPQRKNVRNKVSPLLESLRREKEAKVKGGIYHRTQIDLTYNSNHIEGSRLTKEQTRYIYETNTIGITDEAVRVDDIIETTNHFRCIDYIIDHATEPLSESMIKQFENVGTTIRALLKEYRAKKTVRLEDILDFHQRFELIHPFQDGNGRVGRLIMFKECLKNNIVPFIITDELKMFYYRGLHEWPQVPGYLTDTCLAAQDNYKRVLDYFKIKY